MDALVEVMGRIPMGSFHRDCRKFISGDGKVGPWCETLINALELTDRPYVASHDGRSCFFNDMNVSLVCPGFGRFDNNKKKMFWIYAFAAIAHRESSCNPHELVEGTNDLAESLLQLEHSYTLRNAGNRDPVLCKTDAPYLNSFEPKFQFECGASIMRDRICLANGRLGEGGYWQELTSVDGDISVSIARFPGCGR